MKIIIFLFTACCVFLNIAAQTNDWQQANQSQQQYHKQLDSFRHEFGVVRNQPAVHFFLFEHAAEMFLYLLEYKK